MPALHVIPQTSTIASHLPRAVGLGLRARAREAARPARRRGRTTRWCCAASATRRSTTRRRRARSTRRPTCTTCAGTARSCSCARTTGSASAPVRRRAGWPRRSEAAGLRYFHAAGHHPAELLRRDRGGPGRAYGPAPPGGAAPEHGPVHGPRRLGRRDRLPLAGRDPGRPRPRPAARHRARPGRGRPLTPERACSSATSSSATSVRRAAARGGSPSAGSRRRDEVMAPLVAPPRSRGRAVAAADADRPSRGPRSPWRRRSTRPWPRSWTTTTTCWCSARTWRQGRGLRRDPRTADAVRRRRGSSTRCSTSRRSSAPRSAPAWPASCPCPRSSTSPTCTTPRTSCAARRPRCAFFSAGQYPTRWWCGSPGWPTRRASAATSTTTTHWPCCATSPASWWRSPATRDDARPRCCASCLDLARDEGRVCVFVEPIARYHTKDLLSRRRRLAGAVPTPRPAPRSVTSCVTAAGGTC